MDNFKLVPEVSPKPSDPSLIAASPPPIIYRAAPSLSQPRFRGRPVFKPEIDLNRYSCRVHVDWVFLHVRLRRRTWSWVLAEKVEREVEGPSVVLDREAHHEKRPWNHVADEFRVKLHDPSMDELRRIAEVVEEEWGLVRDVEVIGIEVAVDFYPTTDVPDEEVDSDRHKLVAVLQRHHLAPSEHFNDPDEDVRFVYPRKNPKPGEKGTHTSFVVPEPGRALDEARSKSAADVKHAEVNEQIRRCAELNYLPMPVDGTLYRGRRRGEVMFRVQNKVKDGSDPESRDKILRLRKRRARVEVTLIDEGVRDAGIETLDDLASFDFVSLKTAFFTFWLPTFPGEPSKPLMKAVHPVVMKDRRDRFLWGGCYLLDLDDRARAHFTREVIKRQRKEASEKRLPERERQGRGKNGRLVAWNGRNGMNRKVGRALRDFNTEWGGG